LEYTNPGKLFVERFGLAESVDDVMRYVNFLREETDLDIEPPVDLARIYSRFGIPNPKRAPLSNQQALLLNPESGLILVKEDDPAARQRFSEAHELMELLFSALPWGKGWTARQTGIFKSRAKELLCNEGAAELLMPQAAFVPRVRCAGVSYQTACQLALEFRVSTTAALVQMVRVGPGRHAIVLWRMKNKPHEIRGKAPINQLSLFGDLPVEAPPKKLRVEWSLKGPGVPFIPTNKSAPADSSIYRAWQEGEFTVGEDRLELGATRGLFRCESQPFEIEGERHVLSLLHWPGDVGCGPSSQR
jgi:hypothetical protein